MNHHPATSIAFHIKLQKIVPVRSWGLEEDKRRILLRKMLYLRAKLQVLMSWGTGVEPIPPINRKFPYINLVVYRFENNFNSAFYLIFHFYYNLLSFLGPSDVFKNH